MQPASHRSLPLHGILARVTISDDSVFLPKKFPTSDAHLFLEQANEGRKPLKMNNICCSKDLITHVHINNERAVNNKNKVPEI